MSDLCWHLGLGPGRDQVGARQGPGRGQGHWHLLLWMETERQGVGQDRKRDTVSDIHELFPMPFPRKT